jgi:hypothetical protein
VSFDGISAVIDLDQALARIVSTADYPFDLYDATHDLARKIDWFSTDIAVMDRGIAAIERAYSITSEAFAKPRRTSESTRLRNDSKALLYSYWRLIVMRARMNGQLPAWGSLRIVREYVDPSRPAELTICNSRRQRVIFSRLGLVLAVYFHRIALISSERATPDMG